MGSIEIMNWLQEGANAGDPIRGALYVVTFVVGGLYSVLFEGAVI
ncbi:hypothetical protein [Rhodococcus tukisamuensis]|uniref:Uncharacterized protein n=1 Tax=Rhodococcus tukisamuensis TaxID=168276 RepID=A0A1G7AUP9_9NOCA|nr:hypothetical protein [Rhodococcus tukisamuensis]SDE18501.1 hypothetical protein SAMN05444580_111125 [Rhodococcus tukisamuensis]